MNLNGSFGNVSLVGSNITLSQNASTITLIGATQSVQTQGSVEFNGSTGQIVITAGSNITLSQNASTITVNAASQSVQTQGMVSLNGSTGELSLVAGNNVTLSQNASTITVSAASQSVQTQNNVDLSLSGNTTGTLALISSGTAIFAGGNNITLSQNGQSVTISGPNTVAQSVQTQNLVSVNGSTGAISISGGANVTVGNGASTVTISVAAQSVQTQNLVDVSLGGNTTGTLALISSGTMLLAGGNNITLSQNGQSVTIEGNGGGNQTGISGVIVSNTTYTSGTISFVNSNGISFGSSGANGISASYTVPTVPTQTNQTIGVYASSQTTGQSSSSTIDARSFTHVGQGIISVGVSAGSLLISATTAAQTVQTQNVVDVSMSGNTTGTLALVSSGTMILAGGNNITLSQNGQSVTISGANAAGAQTGISGVIVSNTTYTSGTISFVNSNGISFGSSGANGISASYTVPTQTNQTVGIYASSQTTGQSSSSTIDARSFTHVGQGIVSIGMSGGSLLISATTVAQTVQTQNVVDVSLSGNTVGALALISSGTMILAGGNNITLSQNGQSVTVSGPNTAAQTNQTIGVYASSQTTGQSSSTTLDARSFTHVGQGIVSVGLSAGSLLISATTVAQTVQTQNLIDVSLSGNTTGTLALVSSGTMILAGGNNITLSQNGQSVTISGPNVGGAQTGISGVIVSNTTYTSGTISFVNSNGISFGSSGANGISASYTVPTQSNQTLSFAMSSQTVGNTSGASVDARSITWQGMGAVSVGASTSAGGTSFLISAPNTIAQTVQTQNVVDVSLSGNTAGALALISSGTMILAGGNNITLSQNGQSVTISAPNAVAQTNQTIGIYGSSQTTGQSSSSTIDARSFTAVGQGIVSVGLSAGSLLISATTAAQTVQTQNLIDVSLSGNTTGTLALVSSGTLILAGGNNITLSQNGQSVTISGPNVGGAQTGISGVIVSNTTYTSGTISFVNSNGISFGSSGANGISASYTVPTQTNQTIGFYASSQTVGQSSSTTIDARSLTAVGEGIVSVGFSAGSLLISATTAAQTAQTGISGVIVSNTTYTSGTISFVNSNGISFGSSGANGISASYTVPTQSNQTIGFYASSQTVGQSSSTTIDARSLTAVGQGIVSAGFSAGSLLISATTVAQTNQTVGVYASSQTTGQSSSTTIDARSLTFVGQGNVSVGVSAGSVLISATGGAGAAVSIGMSTMGNTSGTTGTFSNQYIFAGTNNLTLSQSTGAGGATLTISGPTISTAQLFITGNTTGTTAALSSGSIFFAGGNNITLSQASNNTVTISANAEMPIGISNIGNTLGSSGLMTGQMVFAGGNNITLSQSTVAGQSATMTISANAEAPMGLSNIGNTSGNSGMVTGQIVFAGGNNVTLSGSTNGASMTVTVSAPNFATNTNNLAWSLSGNSTSAGGGYVLISTGTGILAGGPNVTLSQNGQSVSISAGLGTLSKWYWPTLQEAAAFSSSAQTQSSASIQYVPLDQYISFSRVDIPVSVSVASSGAASSAYFVLTNYMLLFTRNGSTLSPLVGTSQVQTIGPWFSNGASLSNVTGYRYLSFPLATMLGPGEYWVGVGISSSSGFTSGGGATTALNATIAMQFYSGPASTGTAFADFGSSPSASTNVQMLGLNNTNFSATSQTVQFGNMTVTGTAMIRANIPLIFRNY
jgi:hypothetical protein